MSKLLRLFLVFFLVFPPQTAHAWSEGGHHLIAVMAFRKLPKDKQQELIRILRAYPRFEQDFRLPKKVKNADEWLIGRAGYWPDVARSQPEYNRPEWHYELGSTMNIGKVNPPAFPGPLPADATSESKVLHIAQALELNTRILHDKSKPYSERAIALCWVAHLFADAHQPCHAGSLYVEGVFPDGDRGGNSIKTRQSKNLHALWDGLLGPKWDKADVNRRANEMPKVELAAGWIDVWLKESRDAAVASVYAPEVMEPVSVALRAKGEVDEVNLSESYLKNAGAVAKQRAAEASVRLAEVFKQ